VLDARGVEVVAHDLSGIVDADGLSLASAGEVYVAESAAIVRKAAQHAPQVCVHPDDQASPIDARSEASGRARDGENLVDPAGKSECGEGRSGVGGIESERADCGGAVMVEDQRPRRPRIVDARERVDLHYSQPSSDGIHDGDRGAFEPNTGWKIQ
jgi:hypothetical protein